MTTRRYKLYVDGMAWWNMRDDVEDYTIIHHRNAKKAARDYGRNVKITTMSGKVVSAAAFGEDGKPYNVKGE